MIEVVETWNVAEANISTRGVVFARVAPVAEMLAAATFLVSSAVDHIGWCHD